MPSHAKGPALTLRRAAKFYGHKLVFRDLDCEALPGEVLLVVGGNGAGKSTLLKAMAGLTRLSAGELDVAAAPERTAYLGHATFLYPRLSALQNLAFWARMYGLRRSREALLALLERVGLSQVAEERAGSFSRGMAQRLNLARVFLVEPELVFLDEPGTGLDAASQALLRREIAGLRERKACVVWVSHQVEQDAALADRVLRLANGRAAYLGPAADFRAEGCAC